MTLGRVWRQLREALGAAGQRIQTGRLASRRRARRSRTVTFAPELLEQRELLSVNQITFDAASSRVTVNGTSDADKIAITAVSSSEILVRATNSDGVVEATFDVASLSSIVVFGGDGNDNIYNTTAIPTTVYGEGGDDTIHGGGGADSLDGGAGDDAVYGGAGDDILFGREGNDDLYGEDGDDWADGGLGDDVLKGGAGNDKMYGGEGRDFLYGEAGDDTLLGREGNDHIVGGDGNDWLYGDEGDDLILGSAGNDVLVGGEGNDDLLGEDGDDWADGGLGDDVLKGGLGNDKMYGGAGRDFLYGEAGDDTLLGREGNDYIAGGEGHDYLYGDADNDLILGGAGNDLLVGGEGNDELQGEDGDDWANGGLGDDVLRGGAGNDILLGGAGSDMLLGEDGRDILFGGLDSDDLRGGGDDDLLVGSGTAYDDDVQKLNILRATWASGLTYSARIATIEDELYNVRWASRETVFDDQVSDVIMGQDGQDWLFLTGYMGVYDPNLADHGEHHHHEESADGHQHAGPVILDHPPALEGFALIDSLDKLPDRVQSESVHTLIPHVEDTVLQREHLALFQLVQYSQVSHYAVSSGEWSNPNTWHDGLVPSTGARVLIPIGVEVTVDKVLAARLNTIRVDGVLRFSTTANSELRVDTIVVASTGHFEMGSEAAPIPSTVNAKLLIINNGAIDRVADPFGIGRGLISHGSVSMYGAAVTSYVALQGPIVAGQYWIDLPTLPAGWKSGDSIVLAATTADADQNEVRKIVGIAGNRIYLNQPLAYSHLPLSASHQLHLANTTRNVSISSESSVIERRGHVMFMHNDDVHIANVGFYQLGRTDKLVPINDAVVNSNWQLQSGTGTNGRARYSVHFHRTGTIQDDNPATISGSAVVDSPGWGFVNHSSYVDMTGNVAFDVHGAAFATEVGDEIGSFVENLAIGSRGSGERTEGRTDLQDFGHEGDGFWFQGTGITVIRNIAAGNEGSAFTVYARSLIEGGVRQKFLSQNLPDPSLAGGEPEIDGVYVPMLRFDQNIGYSSALGLGIWYHLRDAPHDATGVFSNSQFWNNDNGVTLPYSHNVILRDLVIQREPGGKSGVGVEVNIVTRDISYENLTVSGYYRGLNLPRSGYSNVHGGSYNNYRDIMIEIAFGSDRTVLLSGDLEVSQILLSYNSRLINNRINHVFNRDHIFFDFGPYNNQRVYYLEQAPSAIPFPIAAAGVPSAYVGLTSLQLWNQYGLAVGGTLAPASVITVPGIDGLISTTSG
jgi:Ca2+-binding RTX toxin-like protein